MTSSSSSTRRAAASMSSNKKPMGYETGGLYDVKQSGLQFRHVPNDLPTPRDGVEFLSRLRENFQLRILERPSPNELVFEMIGVDVSFANALRRIMLSDVPTVAIEHVYMWNNSSIVHDEVLAHRLGLVPINVDPRLFDEFSALDDEATDRNTLVFRLAVSCGRSKADDERREKKQKARLEQQQLRQQQQQQQQQDGAAAGGTAAQDDSVTGNRDLDQAASESSALYHATHPHNLAEVIETPGRPYTKHVYSRDLEWVPQGDQGIRFPNGIRPVHEDILLAKIRPGQSIELEAHARRGTGRDHAKYSPVATASYRLMPHVELVKPVYDDLADELANLHEPGVFGIAPCAAAEDRPHARKAVVRNPYACTMSRNYMRNPQLKESIRMCRVPDHFIFQIESVGMMSPAVILAEALRVLQAKCQKLIRLADESLESEGL